MNVAALASVGVGVVNTIISGKAISNVKKSGSSSSSLESGGSLFGNSAKKKYVKAYNAASKRMNNGLLEQLNKKYEGKDVSDTSTGIGKKYLEDYQKLWNETFSEEYGKLTD